MRRNIVGSRIRFEAFACAGVPASTTVLRQHMPIKQPAYRARTITPERFACSGYAMPARIVETLR
jgi:hypothetical protein